MVQNISSRIQKKSNKIFIFRELNNEELFLLEVFKIRNRIWIKIQRSYLSQIWLNLKSRDMEASEFARIWHVGP
jgi:hypothetical protein